MSEALSMSSRTTCAATGSATGSQVFRAGQRLFDWPDGEIDPSGRGACPVSHFPSPESAKEPKTKGTCGRNSSGSSKRASRKPYSASKSFPQKLSARSLRLLSLLRFRGATTRPQTAQQTALSNHLRSALNCDGSMEFSLTWKDSVTPAGRRICRLRASPRRTAASDCSGAHSGWPTPSATEFDCRDVERLESRRAECKERQGNGNGFGMTLAQAVAVNLSGWPTATATDGRGPDHGAFLGWKRSSGANRSSTLDTAALMAGWSTPSSRDWKDTPGMATEATNPDGSVRTRLDQLPRQATLAGWATPRAEDAESAGMRHSRRVADTLSAQAGQDMASGATATSSTAETESTAASPGRLNPAFSLWLMGYRPEWMECGLRVKVATRSRARSRTARDS